MPGKRLPDRSNHLFHWKSLLRERSAPSSRLGSERNLTGLPKCIDFNKATLLDEFCRDLSLTVAQRSEVEALLAEAKRTVDQLLLESVTIETQDDGESAVVGDLQPAMAQIRKELANGLRHVLTDL